MKALYSRNIRNGLRMIILLAGIWGLCLMSAARADDSCIELSDIPLDIMQQEAPGIIMFCVDDSGSMDWSMVCAPPETNGVFNSNYYIFSDPGDDHYTGSSYSQNLEDNSSDKMKWKSQWSGYNRMYYDPATYYAPWPEKDAADINNPRSNPVNSGDTLNMNLLWHSWGGGGSGSLTNQAIRDAGGVIVDNSDTDMIEDEVIELILDNDNYYNTSTYTNAEGSFSEAGTGSTWYGASAWGESSHWSGWSWIGGIGNINGGYLYSRSSNEWNVGTWTFNNLVEDEYDIYVWYVESSNRANDVTYTVYDNDGNAVATRDFDQDDDGGEWRELAANVHLPAGTASVQLRHYCTSTSNDRACADAVKLVRVEEAAGTPDIEFVGAIPPWNTSSASEQYGYNYLWTPDDDITYTATWTANILDPTITYDVYARWAGGRGYRSDAVAYTVTHDAGTTTTRVNQNDNLGEWRPIAQNVHFSGRTGLVTLEHTRDSTYDRACADAVAFVPSQASASVSNIARRHYYVQNDNGTYLVNLLNNNIEYYAVDLDDPDALYEVVIKDKLTPMTEEQAEAAGIVTGRTYMEEAQNFANWYSFYRRRELTAKNAIANVIDTMNGVYIGIIGINGRVIQRALPVRVTLDGNLEDDSDDLLDALYAYNSNGNTPLRVGLHDVGRYFSGEYLMPASLDDDDERSSQTYPYFLPEKGGTCQQSFAIVMTDGYWTHESPGFGDIDDDGHANTLADVAMHYYDNDLNTFLNNDVPVSPDGRDNNNRQHMVTYSVSFGVSGALDTEAYKDCPIGACPDEWPDPHGSDSAKIDDLFHAAANGRGAYLNADSPTELSDALEKLKQDIESRLGSAASLSTNSVERRVGTLVYQGTYNTAGWFGELKAVPVDVESGDLGDAIWLASEHVPAWDARNILSYNGSSGIVFDGAYLTDAQKDLLEAGGLGAEADGIVEFLRGDNSNSVATGGIFRRRNHPIGDIVHSPPVYYKGTIYIGANDGMLHAVDAATGEEKFCYVPNLVYGHLGELANPGYSHRYYVDGTAETARVGTQDLLVCGLGKGGKGYFCLDITNPNSMGTDDVLWEYPNSGTDDDLGYTFSRAEIANTEAGKVIIFGNGYDSANGNAVLYVLTNINSNTPTVTKIDTGQGGCNGLATPALVDVDSDGHVDFAYAGDLKGNMWKFDLRADSVASWGSYFKDGDTPKPLVAVKNSDGTAQPITVAPEVMLDCVKTIYGKGLMVIFGTGRYLTVDDLSDSTRQTFYGIWDWSDMWEQNPDHGYDTAKTKYLGQLAQAEDNRSVSNISGKLLQAQTVESETSEYITLSDNPLGWYDPITDTGSDMGWFYDLPETGERCIREPLLRVGVAVLISTIPSESPCEAGGSSVIYQVDPCTGGRTYKPQFDLNDDDKIDEDDLIDDLPPTGKKHDKILFEPIEIGDRLYPPDSGGGINPMQVPPNPQGILYWRMIE